MKLESLSFRDRFGILLEKRLSGVAELGYTMLYGKSQLKVLPIPVPPKREQTNVVKALTVIDDKIESGESRKLALDALFKTLLHNLMTGKIRVKTT